MSKRKAAGSLESNLRWSKYHKETVDMDGESVRSDLPVHVRSVPHEHFSPLCPRCQSINFGDIAWLNEPRIFKPFPAFEGYTGCINATMAGFYRNRPTLGTMAEVLSRASECAFCKIVADRLRQYPLQEGAICAVQAVEFCDDYVPGDLNNPPKSVQKQTKSTRPFEPRLPPHVLGERTTTRLAVILTFSNESMMYRGQSDSGRTVLEFQACATPAPTVQESLNGSNNRPHYGGRRINPKGVDPALLKFWIEKCERDHGKQCGSVDFRSKLMEPEKLHFIDIVDNCIVPACGRERYVALSYMWGATNNVVLKEDNYAPLMTKGSLLTIQLPATIRDAMTVAHHLGVRYLWVDSLCIKQDDGKHKASQIAQMASVYAYATVTIIAAFGNHADTGLSRVSVLQDYDLEVVKTKDVSLIPVLDFFDDRVPGKSAYSSWYTRGWTMQEHLLSTRKLIFSTNQVYWSCKTSHWLEETQLEVGSPRNYLGHRFGWINHQNDAFRTGIRGMTGLYDSHSTISRTYTKYDFDITILLQQLDSQQLYEALAIRYMTRSLTYDSDRLNAFAGILNVLTILNEERFIWGLPERQFVSSLLWEMRDQPRTHATQEYTDEHGQTSTFPLPSWSWISWKSSLEHKLSFQFDRDVLSEIFIYQVDANGNSRLILDEHPAQDTFSEQEDRNWRREWRSLSTHLAPSQRPFDSARDKGQLRFWSSTAPAEQLSGNGQEDLVIIGRSLTGRQGDANRQWRLHALVVAWDDNRCLASRTGVTTIPEREWVDRKDRRWELVTLG